MLTRKEMMEQRAREIYQVASRKIGRAHV